MSDSARPQEIRLNKAIADSGYCARRKADALIAGGKVQVNGQTVTELGTKVNLDTDRITILGQPLPKAEKFYLLLHKPTGYVTSRKAGRTQKSIYELLPEQYRAADPAGRLDQDSSGALILSSDGDFLYQITHPRFHVPKLYEITVNKPLQPADIQTLQSGVKLMPENKLARMSKILPDSKNPLRYRVELITGYNRQIRRTLAELGYLVKTLQRLSFGPVSLGKLPAGHVRQLTETEQAALLSPPPEPQKRQHTAQNKNRQVKNHDQDIRERQTKGQTHKKGRPSATKKT